MDTSGTSKREHGSKHYNTKSRLEKYCEIACLGDTITALTARSTHSVHVGSFLERTRMVESYDF